MSRRPHNNKPPVIDGSADAPSTAAPVATKPVANAAEIAAKRRGIAVEDFSDPAKVPPPAAVKSAPKPSPAERHGIQVQDFSKTSLPPTPAPGAEPGVLKRKPAREVEIVDYTTELPTPQPNLAKAENLVEFIHAPNKLKKKVGEGAAGFDAGVFLRAKEAVKNLAANYIEGIAPKEMRDLTNMVQSLNHFPDRSGEYISKIFNQAHEIKAGGGSYGYPLISRIAESLCKLTEGMRQPAAMDMALIKFHQDALNIVVRKKIKGIGGEIGQLLVEGLEIVVAKHKAHDPSLVMEHINQFLEKLDM